MTTASPLLVCPKCKMALPAVALPQSPPPANSYDDCLRRCEPCGIGYSNSREKPTLICRNPLENLPQEVRAGVEDAVADSLSDIARPRKLGRMGFSTSEDAVTWTVFSFLARHAPDVLRAVGRRLGLAVVESPTVLLWGAPVPPCGEGLATRAGLVSVVDAVGEEAEGRSEPDIILDYGAAGLVFIEVKLHSSNDVLELAKIVKFERYLAGTSSFANPADVNISRLYELARNWRIGWDLAAGRPFRLVNLGPASLFSARGTLETPLDTFCASLATSADQRFEKMTWPALLRVLSDELGGLPEWLSSWLRERGLAVEEHQP